MILSASRRTDIPTYHGEWFMNRLRAGFVLTRNPMNHSQIQRLPLSPDVVDCIVFWTKNAAPFLKHLDELDHLGYRYYFQHSLTPYGTDMEPGLPAKDRLLEQVAALGRRIGRDRLVWRYDPILLTPRYTLDFHKSSFERYCSVLAPITDEVVISFIDLYARLRKTELRACTSAEMTELAGSLSEIARRYGLTIRACSEAMDMTAYGIQSGSCIDARRIERVIGCPLSLKPAEGQRASCGCCESVDIGAYNTCLNGCRYCYANYSDTSIRHNLQLCDPQSPLLLGQLLEGEKVRDRNVTSHIEQQLHL